MNSAEAVAYGLTHRVTWDARVEAWRVGTHPDGRAVWVHPLMFTSAIIIGPVNEAAYDDRWCYQRSDQAIRAAQDWLAGEPVTPEPTGWHRHPSTGRRRPNGDRATEYVEH